MELKAILAKVAKGEALTEEERAFLGTVDLDKVSDSKAAAARKSSEQKLKEKEIESKRLADELEALRLEIDEKANANKPEIDKLANELKKLQTRLTERDSAYAKLEGEKKAFVRGSKIDRIMGGLKFVDKLDPSLPRLALERALAQIADDDLDSEDSYKPILSKFVESNPAIMLDTSAGGGGTPAKGGITVPAGSKSVEKMSALERETDMKKRGLI